MCKDACASLFYAMYINADTNNVSMYNVLTAANACGSNPCPNGYCSNTNNGTSYTCSCYYGYSGQYCESRKCNTIEFMMLGNSMLKLSNKSSCACN